MTENRKAKKGVIMINLAQVKITPREHQVLDLLVQGGSNKEIAAPASHQSTHGKAASAYVVPACWH